MELVEVVGELELARARTLLTDIAASAIAAERNDGANAAELRRLERRMAVAIGQWELALNERVSFFVREADAIRGRADDGAQA